MFTAWCKWELYIRFNNTCKTKLQRTFWDRKKLKGLIFQKFGLENLSKEEIIKIKDIDDSMLYYKFQALMGEKIFEKEPYIAIEHLVLICSLLYMI